MKIGFLLDSLYIPAWAFEAIQKILSLDKIEISCIIINKNTAPAKKSHFLYNWYHTWDNTQYKVRYIKPGEDAFEEKNIQDCLPKTPVIDIHQKTKVLDVLIHISGHLDKNIPMPKEGIWYYQLGQAGLGGFWETYYDKGTVEATLQAQNNNKNRLLAAISSPISELHSPALTHNSIAWDSAPLLYLCLKKLLENRSPILNANGAALLDPSDKPRDVGMLDFFLKTNHENTPSMIKTILMLGKFTFRYLKTMPRIFTTQHWSIYFSKTSSTTKTATLLKNDFIALQSPKGVYWADPFPVTVNKKNYILFEEYIYNKNKGVIKVIEINKDHSFKPPKLALEEPFHISFPFVFFEEDTLYLLPEAAESKELTLYKCVKFPNKWEKVTTLLKDRWCYDPVLFKKDGKWWLFVTEKFIENASCYVYGNLYFADSLLGPFKEHPMNPISTDCRYTRAGGYIIQENEEDIRVIQDCSRGYGYKINFLKIKTLTETVYEEELMGDINPEIFGTEGIHTLNHNDALTTIDTRKKTYKCVHR